MRLLSISILIVLSLQVKAQSGMQDVIAILNEPIQEQVQYTLDTMFKGQDTIFTETDSFILFTTPDMVIGELDTAEYRFTENSTKEWNYNGDELTDLIGIVYLADKRTQEPLDAEANRHLVIATGDEDDSYTISYFEPVLACAVCGLDGKEPDVSILINDDKLEITEEQSNDGIIRSDEYYVFFDGKKFLVNQTISAVYYEKTNNIMTTTTDWKTMMQNTEYEPAEGDPQKSKAAIFPAEMTRNINVDGKLEEPAWNKEHKLGKRPVHSTLFGEKHTMNDLFARYSLAWNQNNLFIALDIKDDVLVPVEFEMNEIKGDYIQIDLDLNPNMMREGALATGLSKRSISLALGFDKHGSPTVKNLVTGNFIEGVNVAYGRKEGGYTAEIQLTKTIIKELTGIDKLGKVFKVGNNAFFTVSVGDADNRENTEIQNVDASSSMDQKNPFQMGKIEFFRTYNQRTLKSFKK